MGNDIDDRERTAIRREPGWFRQRVGSCRNSSTAQLGDINRPLYVLHSVNLLRLNALDRRVVQNWPLIVNDSGRAIARPCNHQTLIPTRTLAISSPLRKHRETFVRM